jgi:hypothetical protein
MPLTSYKEVASYGKMIHFITSAGLMPPWKADGHYSSLKAVNKLTEKEVALIKEWIDNKLPEGKKEKVIPVHQKHLTRFDISPGMKQPYVHEGNYAEESRVFVIPVDLKEDMLIDALEFVPGNKKIINSCSISIDTSSLAETFDRYDLKYGYGSLGGVAFIPNQYIWYQWTPEKGAEYLDSGYAKKIPAHCKLLFHITYMPADIAQKDSSYLKLRFASKTATAKIIESGILINSNNLAIQPFGIDKDEKRKFYASYILPKDAEIHSIMPMGQFVCRSWEIFAIDKSSGQQINLLKIPDWDFHWKKKYDFTRPVFLPAGTEIRAIASYDNSEENPGIPLLPAIKIKYGEGKREEMFLVQFDVVYF